MIENLEKQDLKDDMRKLRARVEHLEEVNRWNLFALDLLARLEELQGEEGPGQDLFTIFTSTHQLLKRLMDFRSVAFYKVEENDLGFDLAYCDPPSDHALIKKEVDKLIDNWTFSWALKQNQPVLISEDTLGVTVILHSLATKKNVRGMFVGVLPGKTPKLITEQLNVLSIILHNTAHVIENSSLYSVVSDHNQTLEKEIQKRTAELEKRSHDLEKEIGEHQKTEIALRESEMHIRSIVDNAMEGIITIDSDGAIQSLNPASERIFGYKSAEVVGQPVSILMPEPYRSEHEVYLKKYMRTGETRIIGFRRELSGQRKDGTIFPMEIGVSEMPVGDKLHFIGIVSDITQRKKAEEDLKHYTEELERRNKELQSFTHVASHDLQEPLRRVIAFGDRLQSLYSDQLDERGKDYVERIQNSTLRMSGLIDDLQAYSRMTGKKPEFSTVNLNEVVQEVLSDLELLVERTRGDVKVGNLPMIWGDKYQLRQLFQNLISNGLKFHKKDVFPTVTISSRQIDDQNWEIFVQDNGIGFDARYQEKIFQPFQRLHSQSEFEGTGMGLAICKKIIELHHGTMVAEGGLGKGARFIITLSGKLS